MTTTTKRDAAALETLTSGGFFRYALERNSYTGFEKFTARLFASFRRPVKGIGYATLRAFEADGIIIRRECFAGSCYAQEWEMEPTLRALFNQ
jgi:hypothetical protein